MKETDDELIREYKMYMESILTRDRAGLPQLKTDFDVSATIRLELERRGYFISGQYVVKRDLYQ